MDAVTAAFAAVPREDFLPARERSQATHDGPIPIGHGQSNSQPRAVETMLRLLDVRPGDRILDLGAGSGWTTALLAELTGPEGSVHGVELVPALAKWGAANLERASTPWADLVSAETGVLGDPVRAPYDRILVSAEAASVPAELLDQLADPGRLVLPVAGRMTLVVRTQEHDDVTAHGYYRFVPLL